MSVIFKIPTGLTLSEIEVGTPQSALDALDVFFSNSAPHSIGDDNPLPLKVIQNFINSGATLKRSADSSGLSTLGPIFDYKWVPKKWFKLIMDMGGEILNLPLWGKMPNVGALDANVPAQWPDREYPDPNSVDPQNPDMIVHTYRTWSEAAPTSYPIEINGTWYISLNNWQRGGEPLPVSVIYNVVPNNLILLESEYRALLEV